MLISPLVSLERLESDNLTIQQLGGRREGEREASDSGIARKGTDRRINDT